MFTEGIKSNPNNAELCNNLAIIFQEQMNYKKAIFCEKPIDLDIKKVRKCLETIKKNKTQFMIGFNRRFDQHFQ